MDRLNYILPSTKQNLGNVHGYMCIYWNFKKEVKTLKPHQANTENIFIVGGVYTIAKNYLKCSFIIHFISNILSANCLLDFIPVF